MQFLAADTGGTFTDVAAYDQKKGQLRFGKTLTTYGNLIDGVLTGVLEAGGRLEAASSLRHGTTHVINAFLQRRGARTALVATRGFRDVLEIGRGNRPVPFDTSLRREPPLASRSLRFEVTERMGADGIALVQLDEAEIEELVPRLVAADVQAIAVSFLNSYANPVHEERAASLLRSKLPELYVTTGTALTREWFEYERSSTAVANAYVGPTIATYVDGFTKRLKSDGFSGTLAMMGSNGGVLPFEAAVERPVTLVESGPIGGVIAAAEYAKILELDRVIAFDMGGTTAKCALVESGVFSVQPTYWVGGYAKGFPIRSPVLDIVEVGAGGGSIAWVDAQKRMRVGPRSAGSEPGPACFGRGGIEPTVTDANLVLGRIGGKSFLEGRLPLNSEKARVAIRDRVASPLGFPDSAATVARVAHGITRYDHVFDGRRCKRNNSGARARYTRIRAICIRGRRPDLCSGVSPPARHSAGHNSPHPGNFSAVGMLLAGSRVDVSRSLVTDLSDAGIATLTTALQEIEAEVLAATKREFHGSGKPGAASRDALPGSASQHTSCICRSAGGQRTSACI